MTIGDLEDFEEVTGVPLFDALSPQVVTDTSGNVVRDDKGRPVREMRISAKTMKALVWIVSRRTNPGFSLDDARNVAVTELEWDTAEAATDPKEPSI